MKFIRIGQVTRGSYNGGEWDETVNDIVAMGETKKILARDVAHLTKRNTSSGSRIDFGFFDNTSSVSWGPRYKLHKDKR